MAQWNHTLTKWYTSRTQCLSYDISQTEIQTLRRFLRLMFIAELTVIPGSIESMMMDGFVWNSFTFVAVSIIFIRNCVSPSLLPSVRANTWTVDALIWDGFECDIFPDYFLCTPCGPGTYGDQIERGCHPCPIGNQTSS